MDAVLVFQRVFAVLLGLALGSFLNVCIVRLPRGESLVWPGSHCIGCAHPIRMRDNIPALSWLLLRGRCRDCGIGISARYPIVELASAGLFLVCLLTFRLSVFGVGMAVFCWLLLGLAWMDGETFLLPDVFTLPGILLGLVFRAACVPVFWQGLLYGLLGALGIGGSLLLVSLVYRLVRGRVGMGLGDVKLGCMLGAWLGWQRGAEALFLGVFGAAAAAVVVVVLHRRKTSSISGSGTLRLPLGTFLAAGGIATALAGNGLLRWYMGFYR